MKPVNWVGSSREDMRAFPAQVQRNMGWALQMAQLGGKHPDAKPWRGFRGASVLEIVEDFEGDTYRCVYTVKFPQAVYVLHSFKKKAKHGIATPKQEVGLVQSRLRRAEEHYRLERKERADEQREL